ncbi:MAG TPA: hypothetical protein VN680_04310 [Burkholderiaceae bacterium]|jgi:hypothetical protein|nr:hypothetical protein [Burkholderiaceae bacterium]
MNTPRDRMPPRQVPTLTEVVEPPALWPRPEAKPQPPVATPGATAQAPATTAAELDEARIAERVLSELQRNIDVILEPRLREAVGPVLARLSDALIRELREELTASLRDVVHRAVAQEIARNRAR